MLIDEVTLTVHSGKGGDGAVSFHRDAQTRKGGPDGGNGGNGGSIYFQGSQSITDLREFRYKKAIIAEDGVKGKGKNLFGKNAPDLTIFFPLGTEITDTETGRTFEIRNTRQKLFVVKGGKGGRGNSEFATPTNRTPKHAEDGEPGQTKMLHIELRLIAEIGLVGLPNAGKSSLLAVITNANPKIGDYPFTTLEPNIGMMGSHMIADIPGLIEGASQGKGLGTKFLKHIQKTKIIVHCIDCTNEDPLTSYNVVRGEFGSYGKDLLDKPEIIILNKVDLVDEKRIKELTKMFAKTKRKVLQCSVYDDVLIEQVKEALVTQLNDKPIVS